MQRYRDGFARLGVTEAAYVFEPVGAAFSFARGLERDATVLVADFGGGTSDFSLMRFSVGARGVTAEPLGASGVGVAGDSFDYRIVEKVVSPRLGKGGSYRSTFGKTLPIPSHYYAKLARWHELALMKGGASAARIARAGARRARSRAAGGVHRDHRARSRACRSTARWRRRRWRYRPPNGWSSGSATWTSTSRLRLRGRDFEGWIAEDLAAIAGGGRSGAGRGGLSAGDVDKVFLTGGTSFVPAVQRLFVERFGDGQAYVRRPVRVDLEGSGADRDERERRAVGGRGLGRNSTAANAGIPGSPLSRGRQIA